MYRDCANIDVLLMISCFVCHCTLNKIYIINHFDLSRANCFHCHVTPPNIYFAAVSFISVYMFFTRVQSSQVTCFQGGTCRSPIASETSKFWELWSPVRQQSWTWKGQMWGSRSLHGANWKDLSQGPCMPSINALSLILQKIWSRLKFLWQTDGRMSFNVPRFR